MVRQSVADDILALLDMTNWVGDETLALLGDDPLQFLDYFPDKAAQQGTTIAINTLALDVGTPSAPTEHELGGLLSQQYIFNLAFFASSDAVGLALFSDLADRYSGLIAVPFVTLYDYLEDPPAEVLEMEVESFEFAKSTDQPRADVSLFFGQLVLTDYVDSEQVAL